jgi:hypothetical protein
MALGRQGNQQAELLVTWAEMPRSPGHVFYDRLQAELVSAGFDPFVEGCVFHVIVGGDSTASWAWIPREGGQRFHGIAGTWGQVPEAGLPTV